MKNLVHSLIAFFIVINVSLAQDFILKSENKNEKTYAFSLQVNNNFHKKKNKNISKNHFLRSNTSHEKTVVKMGDFEFDIQNSNINSKKDEYGSGFFKDRFIIVSSKRIGGLGGKKDKRTGQHQTQLFCSTIKENGDLDGLVLYSKTLNTNQNEGTVTFSPDEKTIYFTRNKFSKNENFQLYKAEDFKGNGHWKNEKELPFSSKKFSVEDVYVSQDGKELYFSSNMEGGFGGYDIYVVKIMKDGVYSEPKNLGDRINTELDERYPFADINNDYLYFSSNAYNSLGGLDIFRANKTKYDYSNLINLGPNINSTKNDFAFITKDYKTGYYTSDKNGGKGGTDIYIVKLKNSDEKLIKGNVRDAKTLEIIPYSSVELNDTNGNTISKIITDENGEFNFKVPAFEEYNLIASHKDYETRNVIRNINSAKDIEYYTSITINKINKKKTIIGSVYFAFNSSELNYKAKQAIISMLNQLNQPIKKITLIGNTDYFGSEEYNYKLGLQRAKNVMTEINLDNKINFKKIIISDGENNPIIKCNNCSSKKVNKNRRVDISIEY